MSLYCPGCQKPLILRLLFSCPFEEDLCLRCRLCGYYVQETELAQAGVPNRLVSRITPWGFDCRELLAYCCGRAGVELPDRSFVARWRQLEADTTRLCLQLRAYTPGLLAEALDVFSQASSWSDSQVVAWRLRMLRLKLLGCFVHLSGDLSGLDPERLPSIPFPLSPAEQSFVRDVWKTTCQLVLTICGEHYRKDEAASGKLIVIRRAFRAGRSEDLRHALVALQSETD